MPKKAPTNVAPKILCSGGYTLLYIVVGKELRVPMARKKGWPFFHHVLPPKLSSFLSKSCFFPCGPYCHVPLPGPFTLSTIDWLRPILALCYSSILLGPQLLLWGLTIALSSALSLRLPSALIVALYCCLGLILALQISRDLISP